MDILTITMNVLMILKGIVLMLMLIGVLIIAHEFGHFLAAKLFDVQVTKFGIGFPIGPTLYKKQFGETEFLIHACLFGGYVSFPDDDEENGQEDTKEKLSPDSPRRFKNKNDIQKAIILLAGVTFNYLIAFLIILFCAIYYQNIPSGEYKYISIGNIIQETPSNIEELGAKKGDIILEINGEKINSYGKLSNLIKNSHACKVNEENTNCKTLSITLLREDKKINLEGVKLNENGILGIEIVPEGEIIYETKKPKDILKYSLKYTWNGTFLITNGIKQLFSGKIPLKDFHGIVAVVKIGGDIINQSGIQMGLLFAAVISINLALFNLLPIPALDGGHLLFLILNKICQGRISKKRFDKAADKITEIFFILLIILIVLITLNDIYALIIHKF